VLFGEPGNKTLVTLKAYNDMIPLGWYTYSICWMSRPEDLHPQVRGSEGAHLFRGAIPSLYVGTPYVNDGWLR